MRKRAGYCHPKGRPAREQQIGNQREGKASCIQWVNRHAATPRALFRLLLLDLFALFLLFSRFRFRGSKWRLPVVISVVPARVRGDLGYVVAVGILRGRRPGKRLPVGLRVTARDISKPS